ncbi:hypothetical protein [Paenarthrobacter ureafaciens]|uniref:hypothetical protein n=1 Tax=Paenarthrobacter ureafaciens TaxID=37931 RepID=UPI003463CB11
MKTTTTRTNATDIQPGEFKNVPEGYELNFDSTEPVWFGPTFEESASAQWDFNGFVVWASDGKNSYDLPLAQAKELHRQLTGILTAMGALPTPGEVAA